MSHRAGEGAALQLQDLIMDTENVEDFLDRLAGFAAATLSRSVGAEIECGVTLQRRKRTMTVAGSSPRAVTLDRIEQSLGDGPCIALEIGQDAAAALNFFASGTGLFTEEVAAEAAGFADLAGRALRLAVRIGTAQSRAEDLQAAMEHRTAIDLACGVIMAQSRCSQDEAMAILTKVSSNRNQKLRDVAADILRNLPGEEIRTHFEG
jgi:hypothetical protein